MFQVVTILCSFFRDMAIAKNTPEKPGKYGN
jgi:hypothetical protein